MTTDIQAIISRMTLEEKAALCMGANAWSTTPVGHLSIPEMIVSDGAHGVSRVPDVHFMGQKASLLLVFHHPEDFVDELL